MMISIDDLPTDFSIEGLTRSIERVRTKHLFGDMDRPTFERAIFTRPIEEWPLGHLQDHRVSVPASLIDEHLRASELDLAGLLNRFLCHSGRSGAREMIAEALDLSPLDDARRLIEIRNRSEQAFAALLCGQLGDVPDLLAHSRLKRHQVRTTVRLMLLYYGALEVQLIAARGAAFGKFDFGAELGGSIPTVGGLINGWDSRIDSITYADKVAGGNRPRGRAPAQISKLEQMGRDWLAARGLSEDDEHPPELVKLLREIDARLLEEAKPAIAAWRATAGQNRPKDPKHPDQPKSQPVGARMELSTLLDGYTLGQQIGFASLRLENLALHARTLLPASGAEQRHFDHWNNLAFRAGADGPSLSLYFINQAVVVEDPQTCLPCLDLREAFSNWGEQDEGGKASSLLKSIRKKKAEFVRGRVPVGDEGELPQPARFDILPDYHLGISRTSLSGRGSSATSKKRHELPAHIRQHGVVRLPQRKIGRK